MYLITGVAGFIGSNLADELLKMGEEVVGLDNFDDYYNAEVKLKNIKNALENKKFHLEKTDLTHKEEIEKIFKKYSIKGVYHLAAIAGVRNSIKNPKKYLENNITITENILDQCYKNNITHFVFTSSSSVYGEIDESKLPIKEDDEKKPISFYGAAKLASEHWVNNYGMHKGIRTIILRPFTVYGPRQRPDEMFTKFADLIYAGEAVTIYGNGEQTRDFTYVMDVVQGLIQAMNSNVNGETFNIGGGQRNTVNHTADLMIKEFSKHGIKAEKKYVEKKEGDVMHTHADIEKAKKILNYKPEYTLEKGVKEFVKWYINDKNN